jgi:hypothetical protein
MLRWNRWFEPDRRLLSLILAVALILGGTLLWLGWILVQQDRASTAQRLQDQRDIAADLAVTALQKALARAEEQLADLAGLPPSKAPQRFAEFAAGLPGDSVLIADADAEVLAYPDRRLPFYPVRPAEREPPASLFAEAEKLELRQKDYPRALAPLREMAKCLLGGRGHRLPVALPPLQTHGRRTESGRLSRLAR